jgi:hypothetical protein
MSQTIYRNKQGIPLNETPKSDAAAARTLQLRKPRIRGPSGSVAQSVRNAQRSGIHRKRKSWPNKLKWKHGMRHGRGKQIWKDGSIYEGYWRENLSHGIDILHNVRKGKNDPRRRRRLRRRMGLR